MVCSLHAAVQDYFLYTWDIDLTKMTVKAGGHSLRW